MANIDGTSGGTGLYNTQIPDIEDAADIQTALQLYHYGSSTIPTTEGDVEANSIAGYIKSLNQQVASLTPDILTVLGEAENLNNKVTAGLYSQDSDTDARSLSSLNYPIFPDVNGLAYAGLLTVTIAESVVYQTYQTFGNANALFFRSRTTGLVWSPWIRVSESTHIHDDRYYTESEVNGLLTSKQDIPIGAITTVLTSDLATEKVIASNASGKITTASTSVASINLLAGTTAKTGTSNLVFSDAPTFTGTVTMSTPLALISGGTGGNTKSTARSGIGVFVQQLQPTTPAAGDLWIW